MTKLTSEDIERFYHKWNPCTIDADGIITIPEYGTISTIINGEPIPESLRNHPTIDVWGMVRGEENRFMFRLKEFQKIHTIVHNLTRMYYAAREQFTNSLNARENIPPSGMIIDRKYSSLKYGNENYLAYLVHSGNISLDSLKQEVSTLIRNMMDEL